MDTFVEFEVASDGELSLMIHKLLWQELRKEDASFTFEGDYVRLALPAMTKSSVGVTSSSGSEQYPCRPYVKITPES